MDLCSVIYPVDFPDDVVASELIDRKLPELYREALIGFGPNLYFLLQRRSRVLSERLKDPDIGLALLDLGRNVRRSVGTLRLAESTTVSDPNLARIGTRIVPATRPPRSYSAIIPDIASRVLYNLLPGGRMRNTIVDILSNSQLTGGAFRYATTLKQGRSIVVGADGPTVGHLVYLAHEVGHCLAERNNHRVTLGARLASEVAAFLFESVIRRELMRRQLADVSPVEICSTLLSVRMLDLCFFYFEQQTIRPPFSANLWILRESLFTCPGYQVVYAFATVVQQLVTSRYTDLRPVTLLENLSDIVTEGTRDAFTDSNTTL